MYSTYRADRCRGRSLTKTESAKTNLARKTLGINPVKYEPLASKGLYNFCRDGIYSSPFASVFHRTADRIFFLLLPPSPYSPVAAYSKRIAFRKWRERGTRSVFRLSICRVFNVTL